MLDDGGGAKKALSFTLKGSVEMLTFTPVIDCLCFLAFSNSNKIRKTQKVSKNRFKVKCFFPFTGSKKMFSLIPGN